MDPYLEAPTTWRGAHQGLIVAMRATLNTALPAPYVADIDVRIYIVPPSRDIYPDLAVLERPPVRPSAALPPLSEGSVLVADEPGVLIIHPVEVREPFIQILVPGEERRIVTTIELLSPANKAQGSPGRDLYLSKQQELLQSRANLIEIDLLRRGEHTVAPPRYLLQEKDPWQYIVCLHRGAQPDRFEYWPNTVRQRLPRIWVPLDEGVPDLVLDLQVVFDRNYDEGAYLRQIDYRLPPTPPLDAGDAAWSDEILRARGLR
jgi:hypothetical protein